jgi:hypothetical protein
LRINWNLTPIFYTLSHSFDKSMKDAATNARADGSAVQQTAEAEKLLTGLAG